MLSGIRISSMIVFVVALTVSSAHADKEYYQDKKRGWYWYEIRPKEEEKTKETKSKDTVIPEYSYDQLWNMHPDEFQEYSDQITKFAVQFPTEKNVTAYLKVSHPYWENRRS